jgi:hypothetical protein
MKLRESAVAVGSLIIITVSLSLVSCSDHGSGAGTPVSASGKSSVSPSSISASPFRQDGLKVTSRAGRYRLSLGREDCLEFEAPDLRGCAPAEVAVGGVTLPPGAGSSALAWRHVRMRWRVPAEIKQDELAVRFHWLQRPHFWWAPHLAPEPGYVIAQHVFRSPGVITQAGPLTLAIIPDLDLVGRNPETPWFIDVDATAGESWLGLSRTDVPQHVLFRKIPGMTFAPGVVEIAFYVTAYSDLSAVGNPWAQVSHFLWERWARPLVRDGEPLQAPLENYVRHTYHWAFESWGKFVWQEFALGGRSVGAPQFIVNISQSPNYPGAWFQREFLSVWNQAWFSSLRSASGLYRYARRTGDKTLLAKAALTKEFALSAPQKDGLFPSVLRTDNIEVEAGGSKVRRPRGWETATWTNSDRCPEEYGITSAWHHVLDMSWTGLLMLRWHQELEADGRLIAYARTYADKLLTLQDEAGFFPGWLHPKTHLPGPVMNETPETSLSVTFLLELAKVTGRTSYRAAALKAMEAVIRDIIPAGRWEDFETYWSCCSWGSRSQLGRKVERSAMYKQCSFSMFWTAEALLAAYRATGESRYLEWGRRTLDELAMVQQVWQPPFIYVPALGGFGVMNSDGEWNDSRETLFAELFLDYYRETGDPDLFERGVAALRSGFIMMYCPENPKVRAMWEKVYPWFDAKDYGFTMENYGHGGRTSAAGEGMGSFTIYDWGNGAAAEAANRILDHYGQVYVDRTRGLAFGLDAVDVKTVSGGWEVSDRTGGRRPLRVVFEDASSMTLMSPGYIPGLRDD